MGASSFRVVGRVVVQILHGFIADFSRLARVTTDPVLADRLRAEHVPVVADCHRISIGFPVVCHVICCHNWSPSISLCTNPAHMPAYLSRCLGKDGKVGGLLSCRDIFVLVVVLVSLHHV